MKISKTEEEWKKILTPQEYRVCRQGGTEAPFSGSYCHHRARGIYRCVCCAHPLFKSEAKIDSPSGWPGFLAPHSAEALDYKEEVSLGIKRIEVRCRACHAHLGHLFDDGPPPLEKRY